MTNRQGEWTVKRGDAPDDRELVYRFRWNPTQVVVVGVGILLMVLGGIALARAGADGIVDAVTPEVAVGPWHRTPLMASLELGLGLVLVVSGAQRLAPRSLYRVAGALGFVFGVVLIAQPATFDSVLGAARASGWLYAVLGAGFLGLGFGAPIVFERERVSTLADDAGGRGDAGEAVPDEPAPVGDASKKEVAR